jgi:hypothetical protein
MLTTDPELVHTGRLRPLRLTPPDRDLLTLLADGLLHTQAEVYSTLFGERLIEPGAIYSRVSRLHRLFAAPILRTVPKRGLMLAPSTLLASPLLSACGVAWMQPPMTDPPDTYGTETPPAGR